MSSQTLPAQPTIASVAQPRPRPPQRAATREGEDFAQCLAAEGKTAGTAPGENRQPRKPTANATEAAEKSETRPDAEGQLPTQQLQPPQPATPEPAIPTAAPQSMNEGDAQPPGTMSAPSPTALAGIGDTQGSRPGTIPAASVADPAEARDTQQTAASDKPLTAAQQEPTPLRQPVETTTGTPLPTAPLQPAAIATAPIAPSQPAPALAHHATATPEALPMTIAAAVQGDIKVMTIRLDPADLGNVQVRLELGEDGLRRAHLIVERPATLHQLMQDAPRLEQALASTGSGSADISFSLRQETQQQSDPRQNGGSGASKPPSGESAGGTPEQPAPLAYRRSATAAAHLDMLA